MILGGSRERSRAMACAIFLLLMATGCASAGDTTTGSGGGASVPSRSDSSVSGHTTGSAAVTSLSSADEASRCRSDQLAVAYKDLPGAATGRTYADIVLTNHSSQTCWVMGSVTVRLLDPSHTPVPLTPQVTPGNPGTFPGPPSLVTLEPGGSAAETVDYGSDYNPAPGKTQCQPVEAYISITVPGASDSTTLRYLRGSDARECPHDVMSLTNLVAGSYSAPF
jgi:hypothetical protein